MQAGHCSPSPNSCGDHQCPGCLALPLTQSIQGVTSLYLMSVYSVPRSQFCFNQVTDYVSRSLLSIPQFIWGSSVPQLPGSATDTIYTRCDVTVPDVSVVCAEKSILMWSGHCSPSPNSFGDHQCPGCPALTLTQSIQDVTSLYLMSA